MKEYKNEEAIEKIENEPVKTIKRNKIIASVNYVKKGAKKTSVSYKIDENTYSAFVDGIYKDSVEIEYSGNVFDLKNIIKIKEKGVY